MHKPEREPGPLSLAQGRWLRQTAQTIPANRAIVELGSFRGKSTACLAVGSMAGASAPVIAVDLWTEHNSAFFSDPQNYDTFLKRIRHFGVDHLVTPVQMDTLNAARHWSQILERLDNAGFGVSDGIGLLWIDADHKAESVYADWEAWSPLVAPDGIVAFHDYVDERAAEETRAKAVYYNWGVKEVVDEHIHWPQVKRIGTMIAFERPR